MTPVKNMAASVKARLNNKAKAARKPPDYYYLHYGIERFLYRLSRSPYAGTFILKGGLALLAYAPAFPRPTRDLDLLGFTNNDIANLEVIIREICEVELEMDDGLTIDLDSVKVEAIQEQKEYHGTRASMMAYLERSKVRIQIDVGFDDMIHPEPDYIQYPILLDDLPIPSVRAYPLETILSEKIHTILYLDLANSRLKDFFDIWYLSEYFTFDGHTMCEAVTKTFNKRQTAIPANISSEFLKNFMSLNETNWRAFQRRYRIDQTLEEICNRVQEFTSPILLCGTGQHPLKDAWVAGAGWPKA